MEVTNVEQKELVTQTLMTQERILDWESYIRQQVSEGTVREPNIEIREYFADNVYGRMMIVEPNSLITGHAHKKEHIFVLLKGTIAISKDDDTIEMITGPCIFVVPGGKKKIGFCVDEVWAASFHPSKTKDVEKIKKRLLYSEKEYTALVKERYKEIQNG